MSPSSPNDRPVALFLSALILPGLGQIHIGDKKKGWAMVLSTLGLCILTFAKFMTGVLKVVELHRHPRPPQLQVLKILGEAIQMEWAWLLAGFLLIVLIWVYSILDLSPWKSA